MIKINIDTSEYDELLLDLLIQACGLDDGIIDNQCITAYEDACNYLTGQGYLTTINSRIYKIKTRVNKK